MVFCTKCGYKSCKYWCSCKFIYHSFQRST